MMTRIQGNGLYRQYKETFYLETRQEHNSEYHRRMPSPPLTEQDLVAPEAEVDPMALLDSGHPIAADY